VDGAFLPKTLVDGGSSLNIIFTETLRKMDFDFSKMTACDEPFYGVVPDKAAYPIDRVCLPVTFGNKDNFRMEYLTFEVADFRYSYHGILGRPATRHTNHITSSSLCMHLEVLCLCRKTWTQRPDLQQVQRGSYGVLFVFMSLMKPLPIVARTEVLQRNIPED
jgi:hypothetical protein